MDVDSDLVPEIMMEGMDERSIYIGNVDYSVTPDTLKEHFKDCGEVTRVTIPHDAYHAPKGFGYMQFATEDGMKNALLLDNSILAGRQIKVETKRVNQPGMGNKVNRGMGRGRGRRGAFARTLVRYVYINRGNGRFHGRRPRYRP